MTPRMPQICQGETLAIKFPMDPFLSYEPFIDNRNLTGLSCDHLSDSEDDHTVRACRGPDRLLDKQRLEPVERLEAY